jgi:putative addiction module killer protein
MYTVREKSVQLFRDYQGKEPYSLWLTKLDKEIQRRIISRVARLELGNYGDYKKLSNEIIELRFTFGAGYRIYFAEDGGAIVILLCGGDKKSQSQDIENASKYWQEYKENKYGRIS